MVKNKKIPRCLKTISGLHFFDKDTDLKIGEGFTTRSSVFAKTDIYAKQCIFCGFVLDDIKLINLRNHENLYH